MIFSSHILSEVQTICDRILIIARGKLVAFDEPQYLERRLLAPSEISLKAEASAEEARKILSGVAHISEMDISGMDTDIAGMDANGKKENRVSIRVRTDCSDIYAVSRSIFFAFAKGGRPLLEMALKKANLEDVFLELTDNAAGEKDRDEDLEEEVED